MLEMSVPAAVMRACCERPVNRGSTMAASTTRITITSSSSMSVKARGCLRLFLIVGSSLDDVLKRKDRQQHADHDNADDHGGQEQHGRLSKRHQHAKVAVQLFFIRLRETKQFLVQPARFLGDGDHLDDRRRKKYGRVGEAAREWCAALNFLDGLRHGIGECLI